MFIILCRFSSSCIVYARWGEGNIVKTIFSCHGNKHAIKFISPIEKFAFKITTHNFLFCLKNTQIHTCANEYYVLIEFLCEKSNSFHIYLNFYLYPSNENYLYLILFNVGKKNIEYFSGKLLDQLYQYRKNLKNVKHKDFIFCVNWAI